MQVKIAFSPLPSSHNRIPPCCLCCLSCTCKGKHVRHAVPDSLYLHRVLSIAVLYLLVAPHLLELILDGNEKRDYKLIYKDFETLVTNNL